MLMHHANSLSNGIHGGAERYPLPFDQDLAAVRLVKSVENVHQCGFSRTVFSYNCMDCTALHAERNSIICQHCRKLLTNLPHFYYVSHQSTPPHCSYPSAAK